MVAVYSSYETGEENTVPSITCRTEAEMNCGTSAGADLRVMPSTRPGLCMTGVREWACTFLSMMSSDDDAFLGKSNEMVCKFPKSGKS